MQKNNHTLVQSLIKKNRIVLLLLLFSITLFSQEVETNIHAKISSIEIEKSKNLKIDKIIVKYENNAFIKNKNVKIYKNIGSKTLWVHFPIISSKKENYLYLTNSYSYLYSGKLYFKKGNKIDSLQHISYNKNFPHKFIFYRDPVWKIPTDSVLQTDAFLKINNEHGRSRLLFHLETENQFLKRVETEYLIYGLFIAFLTSMILIVLFFAILKKEYIVIFYAIYITTALIEFLAGKGLGVQFFWSENSFIIDNIRIISQIIGTGSMGVFYWKFYKLKKEQKTSEQIFKLGVLLTLALLFFYVYKYFFGGLNSFYLYVQVILQIIIFCWVLNHIYLTIKNKIPTYLVFAFVLPLLAIIIGQTTNPNANNSLWIKFSGPNLYYIFLSIEIILFTRFIFDSVINTQKKYFKLKKVSDELKYNFQNKALEIQHKEQNKLVSNVHDTFGGYLEALKLRLLHKTENTPEKIQEILDAFYNDYRYLLNSLYAPKINSGNFIDSLTEFCEKLNPLIEQEIKYIFNVKNINLPQEKCLHLYRIISELTTNAIKYSKSSEITILLHQENNKNIILEVTDNGIGFDENSASKKGFGLKNVKERTQQMNGVLEIEATKIGVKVKIEVPINE